MQIFLRIWQSFGALVLGTNAALADPLCDVFQTSDVHQLEQNLSDIAGLNECELQSRDPELSQCRWEFSLGDPNSRATFSTLSARIAACKAALSATRDAAVNHPDFYDAWFYWGREFNVSVSLKDKSSLQQSFVIMLILLKKLLFLALRVELLR